MASTTFNGSALLLQDDLLHMQPRESDGDEALPAGELDHLASSIRQAFSAEDDEGALLVIEVDESEDLDDEGRSTALDHVADLARSSIRKSDIIDKIDEQTIAIGLPGSGRVGMTRVADAIRQRVAASMIGDRDAPMTTTVTIGAVHTTEARIVDLDDLLLAARVNLDSARAAGRNRTNWSDWSSIPE